MRLKMTTAAAVAVGLVVFAVLVGGGSAVAYWASTASVGTTVASGQIAVTQSGFDAAAATYAPGTLSVTAGVTLTNTGTITAPYSYRVQAPSTNTLATAISVSVWSVSSAAVCTSSALIPAGTIAYNWTSIPALTGTLPPTAGANAAYYCIRSSISQATLFANSAGTTMTASAVATSTLGTSTTDPWTATTTAVTAIQSVTRDTVAPTAPTNLSASGTSSIGTTLTWTASTDAYGVASYDIYRTTGGVTTLAGNSTTTSFTDSGASANTTYVYTVKAKDAIPNTSAASTGLSVLTGMFDPTKSYKVGYPLGGQCITAHGSATANGTALEINTCVAGASSQAFQFTATDSGYFKITSLASPVQGWDVDIDGGLGANSGQKLQLWAYGGGTNQQFLPSLISGTTNQYQIVNRYSGMCLDVNGRSTTAGTQLQQYTCNQTPAQIFTFTVNP